MTDFELRQYKCLKLEEKMLENILFDLETMLGIKGLVYDKEKLAPTNKVSDTTLEFITEIVDIKEELRLAKKRTWKKRLEIERFINSVDDVTVRVIVRMRYVEGKTLEHIGRTLGYSKTGVYHYLKRYLGKDETNVTR